MIENNCFEMRLYQFLHCQLLLRQKGLHYKLYHYPSFKVKRRNSLANFFFLEYSSTCETLPS